MGFLDHYRQFRALPPEEVSRRLRAEAEERRRSAVARLPPLDLSATTWHEPPHPEAVNAATFGLRRALHRYGDPAARGARELAAERLGVRPAEVAVGHGAGSLLEVALAHLAAGREVVVPWPAWLLLPTLVRRAGATPRAVALRPDGRLDVAAVAAAAGDRTAAVVVATPNDPTGLPADVDALAARLPAHVWLVVDEALAEWLPRGAPAAGVRERVLRVRSLSKAHALAGLRVGYASGPEELVAELMPPQGIGPPAQAALAWALEHGDDAVADRRRRVQEEHARLAAALPGTSFSLAPGVASFAWLSSRTHSGADIHAALAAREILAAPGSAWGDDRHVRVALRDEPATVRLVAALADLG